jgi:hypothetical protein
VLAALVIYVVLCLVGAPIWLLVRPPRRVLSDALACPLLGLAVLQVFSWYWLRFTNVGMTVGLPALLAIALGALLLEVERAHVEIRVPPFLDWVPTLGLIGAVALAFVVEFRSVLKVGHLTSGSIWNADIALYVNEAGALTKHGFAWAGNIANVNLGAVATNAQGIGPGVYATLAAAAAGTNTEAWQATLPLLLVCVALVALAVRDAAELALAGRRLAPSAVAFLAAIASLFGYVTTNYFLAQILVMPLAVAEWLVLHSLARAAGGRERVAGVILLIAVVTIAVLSYSPMAFLMQPVIVAAVCLGEVGRDWWRRSLRVVGLAAGALVIAFTLVPGPFRRAVDFARHSVDQKRGWPLGLLTPLDVLGLREVVRPPRPVAGIFAVESVILGAVVLAAVALLWRRQARTAIFLAATAFVVLGSYVAVYVARGYSYEQWKWISFFQPLIVAAVYTLVCAAAIEAIDRVRHARTAFARNVGVAFGVVLVALSARTLVLGTRSTPAVWVPGKPTIHWYVVRPSLSDLPHRPAIAHLHGVNIKLPQWDAMWAAYFLEPEMRVYLTSPNYYTLSRGLAKHTLIPHHVPGAPPTGYLPGYDLVPAQ